MQDIGHCTQTIWHQILPLKTIPNEVSLGGLAIVEWWVEGKHLFLLYYQNCFGGLQTAKGLKGQCIRTSVWFFDIMED